MIFTVAAVSAIVPSLLIMWYFHARDVYPEPPKVLWGTFGLGILTIPAVLVVVLPTSTALDIDGIRDPVLGGFIDAFVTAAIPEEFFKFLVVYLFCVRHKEFDEPMDGIVYGVAASLGFATLENVLYVAKGGIGLAIMRAFTAVPGHACWGAIMGYFAGQAKFRPSKRGKLMAWALFWPIVLLGLYDFPLLAMKRQAAIEADAPGSVVAIGLALFFMAWLVGLVWAYRVAARLRKEQVAHAVATGAAYNSLHPGAKAVAQDQEPPGRAVSWLMLVAGILLAGCGGLMCLALVVSVLGGQVSSEEMTAVIGGGVIVGLLPLVVGAVLFIVGVRRLNQRSQHELAQRAQTWQQQHRGPAPVAHANRP